MGETLKSLKSQSGKIALLEQAERDAAAMAKGLEAPRRKLECFRRVNDGGDFTG